MDELAVGFAFEINGEEVDPRKIDDAETRKKIEKIVESVAGKVGGLRCPHHDQTPRFICHGPDFDNLEMEVDGCCDTLVNLVKTGLAS